MAQSTSAILSSLAATFVAHLKHLKSTPGAEEDQEIAKVVSKVATKVSPPRSQLSQSPVSDGQGSGAVSDDDYASETVAAFEVTPPNPLLSSHQRPLPPPLPASFFDMLDSNASPQRREPLPSRYHDDRVWRMLRADVLRCQMSLRAFELKLLESST